MVVTSTTVVDGIVSGSVVVVSGNVSGTVVVVEVSTVVVVPTSGASVVVGTTGAGTLEVVELVVGADEVVVDDGLVDVGGIVVVVVVLVVVVVVVVEGAVATVASAMLVSPDATPPPPPPWPAPPLAPSPARAPPVLSSTTAASPGTAPATETDGVRPASSLKRCMPTTTTITAAATAAAVAVLISAIRDRNAARRITDSGMPAPWEPTATSPAAIPDTPAATRPRSAAGGWIWFTVFNAATTAAASTPDCTRAASPPGTGSESTAPWNIADRFSPNGGRWNGATPSLIGAPPIHATGRSR